MKRLIWWSLLLWVIMAAGCISELDVQLEQTAFIAINGVISNSPEGRRILVTRQQGTAAQGPIVASVGEVYKDGTLEAELQVGNEGELLLPDGFVIEEGASYHVEIRTDEGKVYHSLPQVVQPRLTVDTLTHVVEERIGGVSQTGIPIQALFVNILATVTVPADPAASELYRWQVNEAWSRTEVTNPTDPLDVIQKCYPTVEVEELPVTILTTDNFTPGTELQIQVATRRIDDSFDEKHYFNVYTHGIDQRAFRFYNAAQGLIASDGNLYDEQPAPIRGNLFNVDEPEDLVLGYVEFALADTTRIGLYSFDLQSRRPHRCLDFNPVCPVLFGPNGEPVIPPCKCWDCDIVFGTESLIRPDYWED
ncbi:MAG: DUF4249 family protein [Bacteroidota bacterium]